MVTNWATALDLYGRALLDFGAALDEDPETATFDFEVPAGLGALPHELHDRARHVADASAQLEERLRAALADLAHEQAKLTRARKHRADRPQPRFVDVES